MNRVALKAKSIETKLSKLTNIYNESPDDKPGPVQVFQLISRYLTICLIKITDNCATGYCRNYLAC